MKCAKVLFAAPLIFTSCATNTHYDPLKDFEQVTASTIIDAPTPLEIAPENKGLVTRGEYLVELLGCGSCHTDGALIGEPDMARPLGGSSVGIAYTNPLENHNPGVVYPPNITPDDKTGIGRWSDQQIADAIRAGIGRHGDRRILVMPWQGYATISNNDTYAIVGYLREIEPISNRVPDDVPVGMIAAYPFVHFGVYRSRGLMND